MRPAISAVVCVFFFPQRDARLQLTDELIGDLRDVSASKNTDEDAQRIQELLDLPQNEAVSQDVSHQ